MTARPSLEMASIPRGPAITDPEDFDECLACNSPSLEPPASDVAGWRGDGNYEPTKAMIEAGLETCRPGNHANMIASFKAMMVQAELDGLISFAAAPPHPASKEVGDE